MFMEPYGRRPARAERPHSLCFPSPDTPSLKSCPTLCDPTDGSPPGSRPWDSPGKNTGVGCHFLLQSDLAWKKTGQGRAASLFPFPWHALKCPQCTGDLTKDENKGLEKEM